MNEQEKLCLDKLIEKIQLHQELAGDTSSDTETDNSVATARSNTSGSSSQVTSPRSSLLWDHGYDIADHSIDAYQDTRECEWRKFNITDDDKLTADRHATGIKITNCHLTRNNICVEDIKDDHSIVDSTTNDLPDLLTGTDVVNIDESPVDSQVGDSVSIMEDDPPPLPASSPPTLPISISHSDKIMVLELEENRDGIATERDTNTVEDIDEKFQNLLDFEQQYLTITPSITPVNNSISDDIDHQDGKEDTLSHSGSTDSSDIEDMKNDIEEEFEAILHAFDLNFGQDTYVERFAGRRDKYGFILSPVVEAPSPTPSSLSGYSGISCASPDPFSVFRMSPAPRGAKLEMDLSSLGMYSGEHDEHDQTVPIYQTVQAKRAIVIPDGYGWESGDDLLSPTGSGEWDTYENGLSTPPVSNTVISLSHLGAHILGWKNPQDAIIEVSESETETVDDGSSSAFDSDSIVDGKQPSTMSVSRENLNASNCDLQDENIEISHLTNNYEDSVRNTSPYEVLKASQKNISLYLNKQSDRKRSDSQHSSVTSDGSSNSSCDEDAEDEYSDSESDIGDTENYGPLTKMSINDMSIETMIKNTERDIDVQVTEVLTPRTAILLSGGMYPETTESESDYIDEDILEYRPGSTSVEVEQERDSNMSSYGSGILVTQYTSGDSDEDYSDYPNEKNLKAQSNREKSLDTGRPDVGSISPLKIHSPLDLTFLDSNCERTKQDVTRSPRVFGRHYSELEKYILEEASTTNKTPCNVKSSENDDCYIKEPFYLGLSPKQRQLEDIADSFTNIEFRKAETATVSTQDTNNKDIAKCSLINVGNGQNGFKSQSNADTNTHNMTIGKETHRSEKVITEKTLKGSNDSQKESKTSNQPTPMKIQVSHLSRKGSFTNKVKKGYVHQLSELFQLKEAESTQKTGTFKKSYSSTKKEPDQVTKPPHIILPKENVVITSQTTDAQGEDLCLIVQNSIDVANDSLGFEVTNLQRVDSFVEIQTDSHRADDLQSSEKYEDDFESDSSENYSEPSDIDLKVYEQQLKDTDSDSGSVQSDTEELNEDHVSVKDVSNEDDDIREEIEGKLETDSSDDEELYLKIHAYNPGIMKKIEPVVVSNKSNSSHHDIYKSLSTEVDKHVTNDSFVSSKVNSGHRKKELATQTMYSNQATATNKPAAEILRTNSEKSNEFVTPFPSTRSTIKYGGEHALNPSISCEVSPSSVKRQMTSNQCLTDNVEYQSDSTKLDIQRKCKASSDDSREIAGLYETHAYVDLGSIFWSQNLDRYRSKESVCTKSSHKSSGLVTNTTPSESSLFNTFSRLKSDKDLKRKCNGCHEIQIEHNRNQLQAVKKRKTNSQSPNYEEQHSICQTEVRTNTCEGAKLLHEREVIEKGQNYVGKKDDDEMPPQEKGEHHIVLKEKNHPVKPSLVVLRESESDRDCDREMDNKTRYPYHFSKQLYGSYSQVQNIKPHVSRGATHSSWLQHSGLAVTCRDDEPVPSERLCKVSTLPNDKYKHGGICHAMSNTTASSHSPLSIFEYPQGDLRNSYFKKFNPDKTSQGIDEDSCLNYDPADQFIENIDGRIIYPEVFEYSCYNVKTPILSPAQRESLNPRSRLINHCDSIENQQGNSRDILFSNSNHSPKVVKNYAREDKHQLNFSRSERLNDSRQAAISPVSAESNTLNCNLPYASKQLCVHADIKEGGLYTTAVKNDFFHKHLGGCLPKEISDEVTLCGKGDMRNDMQTNDTEQRQSPLAVSRGINGLSLRQTDTIYHQHMSEGDVFTYDDHDADRNVLEARGGGTTATVLIQTLDSEHVLEDERGQLKIWPYSDFEDSFRKLPITLHRAKKKIKLFVRKTGMSQPPSNMTVIQTAQLSTEMPENKTIEKYHSSAVLPENRNTGELMQTHGESVQSVLFKDTNGNMLTEEELSAILPRIADSISKMKDVDAEEILPGITQSVTKLQNGGNLVITTMTRKLDGEESDESGRGSPVQPHPVLNVDDIDNSKIFLVQDSKGELFYVEDITSESQESAYFSSRNTSESVSDGGYSPGHGISQIKQVGKSNIRESTAEEILSAMYDQDGIQEITENEEEWSERTYEYDRPRLHNTTPRQGYSKDAFKQAYMVEEPETLPRGKAGVSHQDRFESSYQISGSMPWIYDGGVSQSYSQATQGQDEMDSASAISGNAGGGFTRTTERLTVEAETDIYPLVPVNNPLPPVPYVPPLAIQTDNPQYSLVKVDVTANKQERVSPKPVVPELSKTIEAEDKPIYKTVAHIHTREKQPPVKSEMAESKKYRIISSKATETNEEEQETRMSLDEVDYKFSAENVEYKVSPTVQHTQYYFRNATNLETPKRYKTEKKLELNNSSDQKFKSEIQVLNNNDHKVVEENNFYRYDEMKSQMEHTDTSMKVVRGSYLIKNNLEEVDGSLDDNLNMFDGDFTLCKDNPLYQSDEDLYRRYEREKNELAQKQQHFQRSVNQDISFETVDRYSKSKTVQREERPKQSLSELLLSRLSTVDSKDIRQKIDVKHHSEDIYGDPRFLHVDGTSGEASYSSRSDFDTVGEKVDLLIKDGKAFITVKVTAERIVPLDMEFNVWRKNQAIVTRTIEVDLLATEQRRRLYYKVMEEPAGHGAYHAGPNETILDSKQTLELFTKILGAADGEGDKEDITVRTRSGRTTRPFTSGMDLLY